MKKSVVLSLLGFTLLFAGCTQKKENSAGESSQSASTSSITMTSSTEMNQESKASSSESALPSSEQTITGVSGTNYKIALPSNWQEVPDFTSLNPDNDFMLSDALETKYLAAVVESKQDFADLETYLGLVQENLATSFDTTATFLPIPDTKAYFVDFPATVEGLNIHYIYYVLETKNNYVQLYGWTLESLYDSSKEELTAIMNSFKEE
ncbi:hypothetical protein ACLI5Y_03355 [Enterococcus innesii]|uniref:hypothetical protein n=2 Tax=Enterococcus innesii TaxID=2839759 RepID=UPI003984F5B5